MALFGSVEEMGGLPGQFLQSGHAIGVGVESGFEADGRAEKFVDEFQKDFNDSQSGNKLISLADLIVLGGCAAVEKAAADAPAG